MTASKNLRASAAAAAAAVGLLLLGGAGYRLLAAYLARPTGSVPLPERALERLPVRIGAWAGHDVPIPRRIAKATDTDARLNRLYTRTGDDQPVMLYVAYGVRGRDLMPHRPKVCYPAAGWTLRSSRVEKLPLDDRSHLECELCWFYRGGLDRHAIVVLNYYVVDGRYCPDVSLLRWRVWRGSSGIRYMAQVQVACEESASQSSDAAVAAVRALARASAKPIRALFPAVEADRRTAGKKPAGLDDKTGGS